MEEENSPEKQDGVPKWLHSVQEQSWQAEIILSSLVLFSLFQIPETLDAAGAYISSAVSRYSDFAQFLMFIKIAIRWLIAGFVVHLVFRGVWIAWVGLSFVFPKGIDINKVSHFQDGFYNTVKRIPPLTENIVRLEKLCSTLFSISFFLFMSLVGFSLFYIVLLSGLGILTIQIIGLKAFDQIRDAYMFFFLVYGCVVLLDYITLGYFRKYVWFAKLFYPVYRFTGWLMLSPLYRNIYYLFLTNFKKWQLVLALAVFGAGSLGMFVYDSSVNFGNKRMHFLEFYSEDTRNGMVLYPGYYAINHGSMVSQRAHIPSESVKASHLPLFVNLWNGFEDDIAENCGYAAKKDSFATRYEGKTNDFEAAMDSLKMNCLNQFFQIRLNGEELSAPPKSFFYDHPVTKQKGIMFWVDLEMVEHGPNTVEVWITLSGDFITFVQIPFIKE